MTKKEMVEKFGAEREGLIDTYLDLEKRIKKLQKLDMKAMLSPKVYRPYIALVTQYNALHRTLFGKASDEEEEESPLRTWARRHADKK